MQLSNAVSGESRTEGDDERHQLQVRGAQQPEKYTEERRTSAVADSAAEPSYPDPDDDGNEFQFEGGRPTQPMPKRLILPLNISFLGLNLMFLLLSVEVIPAQVQSMVGSGSKGSVLGGMVAGGALLTLLCGPLVGMKSDRLATRFGRRRPIMVVSTLCLCIGLLGMAFSAPQVHFKKISVGTNGSQNLDENGMCNVDLVAARCRPYYQGNGSYQNPYLKDFHEKKLSLDAKDASVDVDDNTLSGSLGLFIPFYFVVTVSYVCTITPYNALIADLAHPSQRGLSSGVMGGMILLGNISGAAIGIFLTSLGVVRIYFIIICILVLCVAITVLSVDEPPSKDFHEPLRCKDVLVGFWLPLEEPDFRWVFITRFLMQQGLSTTVGFLEYWLADMVNLPQCWNPTKGVSMLLIPLLVTAALSSVCCGLLSDRIGRRKPLIVTGSVLMGCCSALLAGLRGQLAFYVATAVAVVFGFSFGAYQAVDFALLMDVLPDDNDKSRDIAVWQQALVLPQALAVPIGGVILDAFERLNCAAGLGYIILFSVTAVYFVLSGVFVSRIRRAK
ncbi:hypothetical protein BOX15_Mlig012053g2 [Macrostomum lignano]|uniref:Major facilitator superfamily (MFS) profile domain-containing protein n=1 Tax=Macrostomum lignano TaxID=282301 RepID=A0A267E9W7_9PLAT|nr:hypothetical protein BOX15_Mlig012053g2 [Macrostomum lignano]